MPDEAPPLFIHATALVIGEAGVLIRGRSGVGKSSLALRLIAETGLRGRFARLVGDDRVGLTSANGLAVVRPHPAIPGCIERRGLPIATMPFASGCVARLVVELTHDPPPRLPERRQDVAWLMDAVAVPMLRLRSHATGLACCIVLQELGIAEA